MEPVLLIFLSLLDFMNDIIWFILFSLLAQKFPIHFRRLGSHFSFSTSPHILFISFFFYFCSFLAKLTLVMHFLFRTTNFLGKKKLVSNLGKSITDNMLAPLFTALVSRSPIIGYAAFSCFSTILHFTAFLWERYTYVHLC